MTTLPHYRERMSLLVPVVLLFACVYGLFFAFVADADAAVYSDDFDSYPSGSTLPSPPWDTRTAGSGSSQNVASSTFYSSPNSANLIGATGAREVGFAMSTSTISMNASFQVWMPSGYYGSGNCENNTAFFLIPGMSGTGGSVGFYLCDDGAVHFTPDVGSRLAVFSTATLNDGEWNTIDITYESFASTTIGVIGVNGSYSSSFDVRMPYGTRNSFNFRSGTNVSTFYDDFELFTDGSSPPPESVATRIISLSPDAEITASTTFDASVNYYFNSSELTAPNGYEVCLRIESGESMNYIPEANTSYFECTEIVTSGESTWELDLITLDAGLYQGNAWIQERFTTNPIVSNFSQFIVVYTQTPISWTQPAGTASTTGSFMEICAAMAPTESTGFLDWTVNLFTDALKIVVCWFIDGFRALMGFLFVPSTASLNQFGSLTLEGRFPFQYVYQAGSTFQEVYSTDNGMEFSVTASTSLGDITFISPAMIDAWQPIPSLVKGFLTGIIWYMLLMYAYRKVLRVHDNTETK